MDIRKIAAVTLNANGKIFKSPLDLISEGSFSILLFSSFFLKKKRNSGGGYGVDFRREEVKCQPFVTRERPIPT